MHIPDGVLSLPVLAIGIGVGIAGCAIGLRRLDPDNIPRTALLSAVFFVASLVHFPVGPSSVHLVLNGIVGMALGWTAFPAILVALALQMLLFGFGGVVALGANLMNMALPAVLCGLAFRAVMQYRGKGSRLLVPVAGGCGAAGVLLSALAVAFSLAASGQAFFPAAQLILVAHLPVMLIEGVFTAAVAGLLLRVRPDLLTGGTRHRWIDEEDENEVLAGQGVAI